MIQLENDGCIAMHIFSHVTALNRAIASADSLGLRVEIEVTPLRRVDQPWDYPVLSARVYRPVVPHTEGDTTPEAHSEPEDPPHAA